MAPLSRRRTATVPSYMRGLEVITEARLHTGVTVDGVGDLPAMSTAGSCWPIRSEINTVQYSYMEGEEGLSHRDPQ